jgi:hypothetical protein
MAVTESRLQGIFAVDVTSLRSGVVDLVGVVVIPGVVVDESVKREEGGVLNMLVGITIV